MISKQTRAIRYSIVRNTAGKNFGKNHSDLLDPDQVKTLVQVIGKAGIQTNTYAIFKGMRMEPQDEITDRSMPVSIGDEIVFIHRGLLNVSYPRPDLLLPGMPKNEVVPPPATVSPQVPVEFLREKWTATYPNMTF